MTKQPSTLRWLRDTRILAIIIACLWWVAALAIRSQNVIPVWYDQETTFTQVGKHLAAPYETLGFVNPPWVAVILAPLALLPLPLATLLQTCLYCVLLVVLMRRLGAGNLAILSVLLSFLAFDASLELNLDYLAVVGMIIPVAASGPFILAKPQISTGYYLGLRWREQMRALTGALLLVALTLVIWPGWPALMLANIQRYSLGHPYNLAPLVVLPWPLSIGIGLVLAIIAFRRHDVVLGFIAWLFFMPYLTFYALLVPFALFAARQPRWAAFISAMLWIIYGGYILILMK